MARFLTGPSGRCNRSNRRWSRTGSVLILVIALLVLLALIATAFITTARTDRTAAAQHGYNTEVDLLMQGVITMSAQGLSINEFATTTLPGQQPQFRPDLVNVSQPAGTGPQYNPKNPGGYNNADGLGTLIQQGVAAVASDSLISGHPLIADRLPATITPGNIGWLRISPNPLALVGKDQFSTPYGPNATFNNRLYAIPDSLELSLPTGGTRKFPALRLLDPTTGTLTPPTGTALYLAADTDGDGIADAALFPLPYGPVNGVTYYAAVRILDNGSAVNAAIAMRPNQDGAPQLPGSVFPTNIDLLTLMKYAGDGVVRLDFLNGYKHDGDIGSVAVNAMYGNPFRDNGTARGDIAYASIYDALWTQYGARLGNPGLWGKDKPYHAFPVSEAMVLARRFCLADPDGAVSILEQGIPKSTRTSNQLRQPYNADEVNKWYNEQFGNGGDINNLRSILVVRNPVSTFAPGRFMDRGAYQSGGIAFGERVYAGGRSYICIDPSQSSTPPSMAPEARGIWAVQPWTIHPTKISVNTATFGQLYAAYWAVFARHERSNPKDTTRTTLPGTRQFKTPIRDKDGTRLMSFEQVRQLRSAEAALNVMDGRDGDHAITSRTLHLTDGPKAFTVNAFGTEKQPFITEAIVQAYKMGNPYVAIELHNPYSVPITFTGIHLAYMDHTGTGPFSLQNIPVTGGATGQMPAGAYWVFESAVGRRPDDIKGRLMNLATQTPQVLFEAPQLVQLAKLGTRELYVVRFRKGNAASTPTPYSQFQELATTPNDLVPLDQLNFTGIFAPFIDKDPADAVTSPATFGQPVDIRWHYARNTSVKGHCVWPGMYYVDPSKNPKGLTNPNLQVCHEGWSISKPIKPAQQGPDEPAYAKNWGKELGRAKQQVDPTGNDVNATVEIAMRPALQLASDGLPGPNNPDDDGAGTPKYPYGGFVRPGDILSVPFIGGYTIRDAAAAGLNAPVLDMVSVTMDAVMAEDSLTLQGINNPTQQGLETADDAYENIGHFCPIDTGALNDPDYSLDNPYTSPNTAWRYNFAMDLFDFFDVRSPQDDYLPDVGLDDDGTKQNFLTGVKPEAIRNSLNIAQNKANLGNEDTAGIDGFININTAPWQVLEALNLVNNNVQNRTLAQAIVRYRDVDDGTGRPHGPFRTIWELMKVPTFKTTFGRFPGNYDPNSINPNANDGDFSPLGKNDGITGDFEARFMPLIRISGMITTRSDYFTGYAVVQGWRGANTDKPELVVQRRMGFIADRTVVQPKIVSSSPPPNAPIETHDHEPVKVFTFSND